MTDEHPDQIHRVMLEFVKITGKKVVKSMLESTAFMVVFGLLLGIAVLLAYGFTQLLMFLSDLTGWDVMAFIYVPVFGLAAIVFPYIAWKWVQKTWEEAQKQATGGKGNAK